MSSVKPIKASDMEQTKTFKFFLYGPSGSGKTTIACTAPNPIFALVEVARSARRISGMSKALDKEILVSRIETKADLMAFCAMMQKKTDRIFTCVLDTMSELQSLVTAELISEKGEKFRDDPDKYQLTQPDYGYIGRSIETIIREFVALPHNVIVLCHQKEYQSKRGIEDVRKIVPSLQGDTIPAYIGKQFHAVGYTYVKNKDGKPSYYVSFCSDDIITKMDDGLRPVEVPNVQSWIDRMNKVSDDCSFVYSSGDIDTTDLKPIAGKEAGIVTTKEKKSS